jgi:hypothetical protein
LSVLRACVHDCTRVFICACDGEPHVGHKRSCPISELFSFFFSSLFLFSSLLVNPYFFLFLLLLLVMFFMHHARMLIHGLADCGMDQIRIPSAKVRRTERWKNLFSLSPLNGKIMKPNAHTKKRENINLFFSFSFSFFPLLRVKKKKSFPYVFQKTSKRVEKKNFFGPPGEILAVILFFPPCHPFQMA